VLGKDTTKVQLNYFRNGKGGHEKMIDLGFDASEDFHTYAFEWHKNSIIWFVDGKEVFRRENEDLPVTKGKIMMNAWNGKGVDEWLKAFDDSKLPVTAEYKSIKYTPFAE
jgi:endoglucanase